MSRNQVNKSWLKHLSHPEYVVRCFAAHVCRTHELWQTRYETYQQFLQDQPSNFYFCSKVGSVIADLFDLTEQSTLTKVVNLQVPCRVILKELARIEGADVRKAIYSTYQIRMNALPPNVGKQRLIKAILNEYSISDADDYGDEEIDSVDVGAYQELLAEKKAETEIENPTESIMRIIRFSTETMRKKIAWLLLHDFTELDVFADKRVAMWRAEADV